VRGLRTVHELALALRSQDAWCGGEGGGGDGPLRLHPRLMQHLRPTADGAQRAALVAAQLAAEARVKRCAILAQWVARLRVGEDAFPPRSKVRAPLCFSCP
jgi:hypothetical protein